MRTLSQLRTQRISAANEMRKTDKKIDNALIKALTEICEIAQQQNLGFEWLTHFADYRNFPSSLSIVCIYNTNEQLITADDMITLINDKLLSINIKLKDLRKHVRFDSEESCRNENDGNWNERLRMTTVQH